MSRPFLVLQQMISQNLSLFLNYHFVLSDTKSRKPSAKRGSRNGTASKRPGSTRSKVSFSEEAQPPRLTESATKQYAFTGYNLGDNMLHVSIDQSYLFPQNGALIKVEKVAYAQQNTSVQVTVMYKGDIVSLNFCNPVDGDRTEEVESEDRDSPLLNESPIIKEESEISKCYFDFFIRNLNALKSKKNFNTLNFSS